MSKHTPGPWTWRDAAGAGLQIHGVLPAGLKFDATCRDADGNTSFMLYTLRESVVVGIGDARWVQFETNQWAEMQRANAALISAAPDLLAACHMAIDLCANGDNPAKVIKALQAAIAKAEGKP